MANKETDYKLAAEQLHIGKPLFGKEGALAPILECILNIPLKGEMDAQLRETSCKSSNSRNGKMPKTVLKRETILEEGTANCLLVCMPLALIHARIAFLTLLGSHFVCVSSYTPQFLLSHL